MLIRKGWQWVRLGNHVTKVGSGLTPRGGEAVYQKSGIPLIRSQNIHMNRFETQGLAFISPEQDQEMKLSRVRPGDVLLNITGASIGRVCVVPPEICPANVNQHVSIIRSDGTINPSFLAFFISSPDFQKFIQDNQSGATRQALTKYDIENFRVPLPPLGEQKRIAAILSKADRLRRLRRYARELSDGYLQAVFLEMFGEPVSNPRGWEIVPLEKLLTSPPQNGLYVPQEQYESDDSKNGIEMVHMSDLFYEIVQRGNLKRVKIEAADIEKYSVTNNDLLIARRSLNFEGAAKPCQIPKLSEPLVFESSMIRITPNQLRILPIYLFYYLSNERAKKVHVLKYITQSTISGINQNGVKNLEVIVPPLPLQQKFAQIVQKYERLRAQQREAERQAEHLFQSLLQRVFGGEGEERGCVEFNGLRG